MECRAIVEKNVKLVEQYYPDLRMGNRWEWNHKVAYLSWLDTKQVGQKSTGPTSPVSEDTIGILSAPIDKPLGTHIYPQVFEAVDLVSGTTNQLQWLSFGMVTQNFVVPTIADISAIGNNPNPLPPVGDMVPWVGYDENGFQRLKNILVHDYGRRPQGADFDVSIWAGRYFHNCYMGPEKKPLGEQKALERVKPELCGALGISVTCDGINCSHAPGTIYLG